MNLDNINLRKQVMNSYRLYGFIYLKYLECANPSSHKDLKGLWWGDDGEWLLMGIGFVLGWWKHSGIRWWWYLHNSVNVLKTIELYTLNVWNSWHVYFSETVKMTVFLPLPIPCFYCIILCCSHLWIFSSDILLFANDSLKRQGLQPDPFCFLDS